MRRSWLGAVLAVAGAGCSGISVSTYQDPKADFSAVATWSWHEAQGEAGVDPEISPVVRRRIRNMITSELEAKGYTWAPADQADILVQWVASLGAPIELGPISFRFGEPVDPAFPEKPRSSQSLKEGSLAIDVVGTQAGRHIFWRSIVEGTVDRSQSDAARQEKLADAVSHAMAQFPRRR